MAQSKLAGGWRRRMETLHRGFRSDARNSFLEKPTAVNQQMTTFCLHSFKLGGKSHPTEITSCLWAACSRGGPTQRPATAPGRGGPGCHSGQGCPQASPPSPATAGPCAAHPPLTTAPSAGRSVRRARSRREGGERGRPRSRPPACRRLGRPTGSAGPLGHRFSRPAGLAGPQARQGRPRLSAVPSVRPPAPAPHGATASVPSPCPRWSFLPLPASTAAASPSTLPAAEPQGGAACPELTPWAGL